jgi:uncharacterized membrane protein YgcG
MFGDSEVEDDDDEDMRKQKAEQEMFAEPIVDEARAEREYVALKLALVGVVSKSSRATFACRLALQKYREAKQLKKRQEKGASSSSSKKSSSKASSSSSSSGGSSSTKK